MCKSDKSRVIMRSTVKQSRMEALCSHRNSLLRKVFWFLLILRIENNAKALHLVIITFGKLEKVNKISAFSGMFRLGFSPISCYVFAYQVNRTIDHSVNSGFCTKALRGRGWRMFSVIWSRKFHFCLLCMYPELHYASNSEILKQVIVLFLHIENKRTNKTG